MSENETQYSEQGARQSRLPQRQTVMVVTAGEAAFRKYADLSKVDQAKIDDAVDLVHRQLMEKQDADPAGDLAVEPFRETLWCNIAIIDGALGVGCGAFGYWCSVWIHPEKGVAANCGGGG